MVAVKNFNDLPVEIWSQILSFLSSQSDLHSCVLVNKRLSMVAMEILWSEPVLSNQMSFSLWVSMLRQHPSLRLALWKEEQHESGPISQDCQINDRFMIERIRGTGVVENISRRLSSFRNRFHVTSAVTAAVSEHSNLPIDHRERATQSDDNNNALPAIFGMWIRHLYLDSLAANIYLTDTVLHKILLSTGDRLTCLDLSGCEWLADHAFDVLTVSKRFARDHNCSYPLQNLTALSLQGCYRLSQQALFKLFSVVRNLKVLNLNEIPCVDDSVLQVIGLSCRKLRGISLNYCSSITDIGLDALYEFNDDISELSLCDCFEITRASILRLSRRTPNLTYLRLTGCMMITDEAIESIVNHCLSLRYLFLAKCSITDRTLMAIAHMGSRSKLEYIDTAYSKTISLAAVVKLIKCCPSLMSLGLGGCKQITKHKIISQLTEQPPPNIPLHLRDSYCVLRGRETLDFIRSSHNLILKCYSH